MDFAPSGPYGGLLAIGSWPPLMILLVMISLGNNSGVLHFVDTSLFDQQVRNGSNTQRLTLDQPTFNEAVKVIARDHHVGKFNTTEV